jgi:hypothetical protein
MHCVMALDENGFARLVSVRLFMVPEGHNTELDHVEEDQGT